MKFPLLITSTLSAIALFAAIFLLMQPKPQTIALLDIDRIIAESAPGKAGREHLDRLAGQFESHLDKLQGDYRDAPEEVRRQILENADKTLGQQFGMEEQAASNKVKAVVLEEVEKWRKRAGISVILPAQLVLSADKEKLDKTSEILQAVNQRNVRFAPLPEINIGLSRPPVPAEPPAQR